MNKTGEQVHTKTKKNLTAINPSPARTFYNQYLLVVDGSPTGSPSLRLGPTSLPLVPAVWGVAVWGVVWGAVQRVEVVAFVAAVAPTVSSALLGQREAP